MNTATDQQIDDRACDLARPIRDAIEALYRRSGGGEENTADRDEAFTRVKYLAWSVAKRETHVRPGLTPGRGIATTRHGQERRSTVKREARFEGQAPEPDAQAPRNQA